MKLLHLAIFLLVLVTGKVHSQQNSIASFASLGLGYIQYYDNEGKLILSDGSLVLAKPRGFGIRLHSELKPWLAVSMEIGGNYSQYELEGVFSVKEGRHPAYRFEPINIVYEQFLMYAALLPEVKLPNSTFYFQAGPALSLPIR